MMRRLGVVAVALANLLTLSGCRTATRVTEVPRVDLGLEGGNRGYLVGTPPGAAQLKTTRQMVQTDIELPSFYKPTPAPSAPATVEGIAPPEREGGGESAHVPPAAGVEPERYETYTVQKGDSLWSIAAKPDVYGSATRWRSIFDANRDVLKDPDGIRPGMALKIPRGNGRSHPAPAQDEGTTFKK